MDSFNTGYITGMVCSLVFFFAVGLSISAVVLRAACHFCKEEVPEFGPAMGISFVQGFSGGLFTFLIRLVVSGTIATDPRTVQVASTLISLPFGMIISAAILHTMIPTSNFSKAVLIWFIQIVIVVVVMVVVLLLIGLVVGVLSRPGA